MPFGIQGITAPMLFWMLISSDTLSPMPFGIQGITAWRTRSVK